MLGSSSSAAHIDGSALVSHKPSSHQSAHRQEGTPTHNSSQLGHHGGQSMRHVVCGVMLKPNHTIDTCWKIHGKPAEWVFQRSSGQYCIFGRYIPCPTTIHTKNNWRLFSICSDSPLPPTLLWLRLIMLHFKVISTTAMSWQDLSNAWIIDSGASDHMTGNFSLFNSYSLCRDLRSIRIARVVLKSIWHWFDHFISKYLSEICTLCARP